MLLDMSFLNLPIPPSLYSIILSSSYDLNSGSSLESFSKASFNILSYSEIICVLISVATFQYFCEVLFFAGICAVFTS